jgi:hypothetical protein
LANVRQWSQADWNKPSGHHPSRTTARSRHIGVSHLKQLNLFQLRHQIGPLTGLDDGLSHLAWFGSPGTAQEPQIPQRSSPSACGDSTGRLGQIQGRQSPAQAEGLPGCLHKGHFLHRRHGIRPKKSFKSAISTSFWPGKRSNSAMRRSYSATVPSLANSSGPSSKMVFVHF